MTNGKEGDQSEREKKQAEKAAALSDALRDNLRKRKSLQRHRGEAAPAAIKNKDRLGK